jgi:hypothetical protein
MMRRAFALPLLLALAGCEWLDFMSPTPPAVAYMTVGTYSWGCGYDWNGAATDIKDAPRLAREWEGGKAAAILFRFDPVPDECVRPAHAALKQAGFARVWTISTAKPDLGDPPLLPQRW